MNPESYKEHHAVKPSFDLPKGTTVRYGGTNWTVEAAFESPYQRGPQYSLRHADGAYEPSVHQNNVQWVADAPKAVGFQKDDRVRFRHNGKCGTVAAVSTDGVLVTVNYDGQSPQNECAKNLTLLHSPAAKAAEGPHPMQPALDAIDEERRVLNLQITALQNRSRELKKTKEILLRGD